MCPFTQLSIDSLPAFVFYLCVSVSVGCSKPQLSQEPIQPPEESNPAAQAALQQVADGESALQRIGAILVALKRTPQTEPALAAMACGRDAGNWRERLAGLIMGVNIDHSIEQDEASVASFYTLELKDGTLPKPQRYTRVMAYVGPGSYLEAIADGRRVPHFRQIKKGDAIGDAVILIENRASQILWKESGDIALEPEGITSDRISEFGLGAESFVVGFADGTVWRLSVDVPPELFSRFLTVKGAKENDRDQVLGQFRLDSSREPDRFLKTDAQTTGSAPGPRSLRAAG